MLRLWAWTKPARAPFFVCLGTLGDCPETTSRWLAHSKPIVHNVGKRKKEHTPSLVGCGRHGCDNENLLVTKIQADQWRPSVASRNVHVWMREKGLSTEITHHSVHASYKPVTLLWRIRTANLALHLAARDAFCREYFGLISGCGFGGVNTAQMVSEIHD
ncbi:hypothetical protein HD806DRAFT_103871 [Xylariaceae sp. AK1471]|nr:hypothetical protein HD806DRAFT_103871 [Xylariaceae sp. AK1471]